MRRFSSLLVLAALACAVFVLPVAVQPVRAAETIRVVDEDSGVDPAEYPALIAQAAREYEKLKAIFGTDVGVVTIRLRPKGVARHLPPADIVIPAKQVRQAVVITAHEITHLLTQGWANGLLKEGLAVYAQDRVGEQSGWPNYGRLNHAVALEAITKPNPLVRGPYDANKVLSTRNPGKAALRRASYAVAGSWVTWLIAEKFNGDLGQFMDKLYRTGNYEQALGEPFKPLRRQWRDYLERFKE